MKTGISHGDDDAVGSRPLASMVSGHEDRNQLATTTMEVNAGNVPQWCPAMKTGISVFDEEPCVAVDGASMVSGHGDRN